MKVILNDKLTSNKDQIVNIGDKSLLGNNLNSRNQYLEIIDQSNTKQPVNKITLLR